MDPRHWQTLELPKILERLAAHASFSVGAEKARTLAPTPFLDEIRERIETTAEARMLLETRPQTSLGGARDVRPQVVAATRGAVLLPVDLLDIRSTLVAAQTLERDLGRLGRQYPRLADIAGRIAPCPDLVEEIAHCLDERGEMRDSASAELSRIRHELRTAHSRLQERLQRIIASPRNAPFLQEPIITLREGRYVIPLKADFKGRIGGVVHDRSASGATIFVEPFSVVELNNAWRELQIEEEREVQRVLAELSAHVAMHAAAIEHTIDALADLDLALAKARYAEEIDAVAPALPDHPPARPAIRLLQARHPLLDPQTVIPIDVVLDEATHVLVITGPNTGGKTVTLKTVGLLTLMAQAGLHIPAAAGSTLFPFESVYADIGDEQSIEQSLSTFSSHLTNILSFIDRVDERSLVLLDELGAGTDPAEGAALARALLETFRLRGATTFVATHYPEMKAYAQLTPGVQNACVEFDPETLSPTYRLTIGLPGRSNAFAIARRLGLAEEIIHRAESMISQDERQTENLLKDLHRLRLQAAEERAAAAAARAAAQREEEALRQRLHALERERATVLAQAQAEVAAEIERLREEVAALRRRLQSAESLSKVAAVEEEIEALEEEAEALAEPPPPPEPLPIPQRPLRAGDTVWIEPLRAQGQVLAVEGEEADVQVGPARARVKLRQLELRAAPEAEVVPAHSGYRPPPAKTEIDLRGTVVEEALEQLDRTLDAARLTGLPWLRIVHGKGTGALRHAIREYLRGHPLVASYRPGEKGEGGDGVTVATLIQT